MGSSRKCQAGLLSMRWIISLGHLATLLAVALFSGIPGQAQEPSQQTTTTGTVLASTRNTMVVRALGGEFRLFTFDRYTTKPNTIPRDSEVEVISSPTDDPGVRLANIVRIVREGPAPGAAPVQPAAIPQGIRNTEQQIDREVRRFQMGIRGGVGLNPELAIIGAQAQIGPIFSRDVFFRPNVDFEWGQITKLFAIDPDVIYRLPFTSATGRYWMYFGIGPGLNFLTKRASGFDFSAGLDLTAGVRSRNGFFTELKAGVYVEPAPVLRVIVGYSF
jgi:hypothetical protein